MAAPRRTTAPRTSTPEDTRAQRDRLQAEKEAADAKRAAELTMISRQDQANDQDGVWDAEGNLIEPGMSDEERAQLQDQLLLGKDDDEIIDAEDARTPVSALPPEQYGIGPNGVPVNMARQLQEQDGIEEAVPTIEQKPGPKAVAPVKQRRQVVVRINADIDPTIGRGRTLHFKRGRRYRMDEEDALHLMEKGYATAY